MTEGLRPSIIFISNLMNFVIATGIFTLPYSLYSVGIVLGTIILIIICSISVVASMFIIETLAIQNAFLKEEKEVLVQVRSTSDKLNSYNTSQASDDESDDSFFIFKRYEISKLANKVFNKPLYFCVVIIMVCYLYISVTSNGILAGNTLKDIIGRTIGQKLEDFWYLFIVFSFYCFAIIISLNNINKLKKLSMFIIACRFSIILIIIGTCIYSMATNGVAKMEQIPKFNISNITIMIGNSLFFFMSHHSIPGMVENFSPQRKLIRFLVIGYIIALILLLTLGYLALFTFSQFSVCDSEVFPSAIRDIFSLNFLSVPIIGYIINYYPLFNIITAAMQLITLKNNILQAIGSCSRNWFNKLNVADNVMNFNLD
jgi:amino acid permease